MNICSCTPLEAESMSAIRTTANKSTGGSVSAVLRIQYIVCWVVFISEIQLKLRLIRCGALSVTPVSAEPTSCESAKDMCEMSHRCRVRSISRSTLLWHIDSRSVAYEIHVRPQRFVEPEPQFAQSISSRETQQSDEHVQLNYAA